MLLKGVTCKLGCAGLEYICCVYQRLSCKIPCSLMLPLMPGSHQTRSKGQGGALSGKVTLATPMGQPPLTCCLCWLPGPPSLLRGCCALATQQHVGASPGTLGPVGAQLTRRELSSLLSWPQPICLAQCSSEICNPRLEEELLLDLFVPFFLSGQDLLSEM